jgi:hypothetical protein
MRKFVIPIHLQVLSFLFIVFIFLFFFAAKRHISDSLALGPVCKGKLLVCGLWINWCVSWVFYFIFVLLDQLQLQSEKSCTGE